MNVEQAQTTVAFNLGSALTLIEAADKLGTTLPLATWYEIDRMLSRASSASQHIINLLKNAQPPAPSAS